MNTSGQSLKKTAHVIKLDFSLRPQSPHIVKLDHFLQPKSPYTLYPIVSEVVLQPPTALVTQSQSNPSDTDNLSSATFHSLFN